MLIVSKEKFDWCNNEIGDFIWFKINERWYILHYYRNKEKHPIRYYIPILCYVRKPKDYENC
jgi:hypothetical protein